MTNVLDSIAILCKQLWKIKVLELPQEIEEQYLVNFLLLIGNLLCRLLFVIQYLTQILGS